jgi:hypothetical protein
MTTKNIQNWALAALILIVSACKPEIDAPQLNKGSADFSKYIAIGNSLTAGFSDGGLYLSSQKTAYPNIIAEQMKLVGGGDFTSPFFDDAHANGSGYKKVDGFTATGLPILSDVTSNLGYRAKDLLIKNTTEIQNLGIPGMRMDLSFVPEFSALNMYFERLLPDAQVGTTSYFNYVQNRNHTFFSLWLGNNDVLGWATNGGEVAGATTTLTNKQTFAGAYSNFINAITAQGQKGVVATIPDVTAIPFLNTVTVDAINAGLKAKPETANYNLIINALDPSTGTHKPRLATSSDLIVLTFNTALIGTTVNDIPGYGVIPQNPIPSNQVLDAAEIAIAKDYLLSYNASIKAIAKSKNLAVFDAYEFLNSLSKTHKDEAGQDIKGIVVDGVNVNSNYVSGNAFSLDGIHLTPMGNAIAANGFIKAINQQYGSTIPTVSIIAYPGVKFP